MDDDNTIPQITPPKTTFYDILHTPILDLLSHHLDIASIISLSRTSRPLSGFYQHMTPLKWNVDRLLRLFVNQPVRFRQQLGLAEGLMAGKFAYEFFDGGDSPRVGNLEVVTTQEGEALLAKYLVENEEYLEYFRHKGEFLSDLPYRYVHEVVTLVRQSVIRDYTASDQPPACPSPVISIYSISAFSYPLRGVLHGSWNTATVHFLSHRTAYSIFPTLSFCARTAVLLKRPSRCHVPYAKALIAKGYTFQTSVLATGRGRGHSLQPCRKIGDRFCWTIEFPKSSSGGVEVEEKLDPVRSEDVFNISETKDELDEETVESLKACGLLMEGGEGERARQLHHYHAKLMRWNKIFC